jgi:signal peptidase II
MTTSAEPTPIAGKESRLRTPMVFWPIVAAIVALDYSTKRIIEERLIQHAPISVIGDWVRFNLTYNTGAAMNLSLGTSSRTVFTVVAIVMITVIVQMYRATPRTDYWQAAALALIAGGATGNLLDRLRSARGVVDFIDVGTSTWRFWTFNVADSGVTCGAILLALLILSRPVPTE